MPWNRSHRGCTLVEALVACGLSASALAATALLHGRALTATRAARATSVAALQLSSMVAMVQANAAGWCTRSVSAPVAPRADCTQQPCAAAQLAALEWGRWQRALAQVLPGAVGEVCCAAHQCVVAVRWAGRSLRTVAATSPDADGAAQVNAHAAGVGNRAGGARPMSAARRGHP